MGAIVGVFSEKMHVLRKKTYDINDRPLGREVRLGVDCCRLLSMTPRAPRTPCLWAGTKRKLIPPRFFDGPPSVNPGEHPKSRPPRRPHDMRWAPLAALSCSYASYLSGTAAFTVQMPTSSGLRRVLVGWSGGRRRLHLSGSVAGTTATAPRIRLPPARPAARRVFQQRMAASSSASEQQQQQQQHAGKAATAANPASGGGGGGRQRASSRYIPSDFRGVRGGPKGKWKARLVSKGQLRQLGTFE